MPGGVNFPYYVGVLQSSGAEYKECTASASVMKNGKQAIGLRSNIGWLRCKRPSVDSGIVHMKPFLEVDCHEVRYSWIWKHSSFLPWVPQDDRRCRGPVHHVSAESLRRASALGENEIARYHEVDEEEDGFGCDFRGDDREAQMFMQEVQQHVRGCTTRSYQCQITREGGRYLLLGQKDGPAQHWVVVHHGGGAGRELGLPNQQTTVHPQIEHSVVDQRRGNGNCAKAHQREVDLQRVGERVEVGSAIILKINGLDRLLDDGDAAMLAGEQHVELELVAVRWQREQVGQQRPGHGAQAGLRVVEVLSGDQAHHADGEAVADQ